VSAKPARKPCQYGGELSKSRQGARASPLSRMNPATRRRDVHLLLLSYSCLCRVCTPISLSHRQMLPEESAAPCGGKPSGRRGL
jgi:hypothetical protein